MRLIFLRLLNPGDHIVVVDKKGTELPSHHGIFIGHGEGIIHVAGRVPNLTVRKTDFYVFIKNAVGDKNELWRVIYENCSPPEEVINRAKQSLENSFGSYSIFKNNCEHFATYCKTGIAISLQIIHKIRDCYVSPVKLFKTAYKSAEDSSNKS